MREKDPWKRGSLFKAKQQKIWGAVRELPCLRGSRWGGPTRVGACKDLEGPQQCSHAQMGNMSAEPRPLLSWVHSPQG